MKNSNFALRLQPSLLEEARKTAEEEGVALNQLINVAVAEKLSAMRTQAFFHARGRRANIPEAISMLKSLGEGNTPIKGDELLTTEQPIASRNVSRARKKPSTKAVRAKKRGLKPVP